MENEINCNEIDLKALNMFNCQRLGNVLVHSLVVLK